MCLPKSNKQKKIYFVQNLFRHFPNSQTPIPFGDDFEECWISGDLDERPINRSAIYGPLKLCFNRKFIERQGLKVTGRHYCKSGDKNIATRLIVMV